MSPRALSALFLGVAVLAPPSAVALGVGRPQTLSALGQSLNLVFPVQLAGGETLNLECVRAEVLAGDARVPATLIQLQLEGEGEAAVRAVRLQSLVQIDEPLVTVNLSLGCPARFTRQFTAFIDPPGNAALPLAAPEALVRSFTPAMRAALATSDARPAVLLAPAASAPEPQQLASVAGEVPAAAPRRAAVASTPPGVVASSEGKSEGAKASKPVKTNKPVKARSERPAPRLQLDAAEVLAVAPPASAPLAASAPPPATIDPVALERLAKLEQNLLKLQAENLATQQQLGGLQLRLAEAQAARFQNPLVYGLGLLSLVLAASSAYLWRRRRNDRHAHESAWWDEVRGQQRDGQPPVAAPSEPVLAASVVAPLPVAEAHSNWSPLAAPDEATLPLPSLNAAAAASAAPVQSPVDTPQEQGAISFQLVDMQAETAAPESSDPSHPVTVEELIDLEQQIDFFLVLGQDEAAIDLLQTRLQGAGASVALPHLKLLEVLQRRGDEAAFETVAQRFAERFGVAAPAWTAVIGAGPGLPAQTAMLTRLQARWRDSGACMALLQSLLTGSGAPLDLQTYRDLLLLYGVARDLSEHEVGGEEIDLFLPLDTPAASRRDSAAMMATMAWQAPGAASPQALEVDISLDDEPTTTRR